MEMCKQVVPIQSKRSNCVQVEHVDTSDIYSVDRGHVTNNTFLYKRIRGFQNTMFAGKDKICQILARTPISKTTKFKFIWKVQHSMEVSAKYNRILNKKKRKHTKNILKVKKYAQVFAVPKNSKIKIHHTDTTQFAAKCQQMSGNVYNTQVCPQHVEIPLCRYVPYCIWPFP